MSLPGFTAGVSLARSRARYVAWHSAGDARAIQPQSSCYCSEPDFKTVCTSPGHCHLVNICHQWVCPGSSNTIDDEGLGDFFN